MAGASTIGAVLADLKLAFPREVVTNERVALYVRELADIPDAALQAACQHVIRNGRFFPLVAELLDAAAEHTLALPSEGAALDQIEARIAWGRNRGHDDTSAPEVHPLVQEALQRVGGFYAYKNAEKPSVIRGQFLGVYREARASTIREAKHAPALPSAPERKELTA